MPLWLSQQMNPLRQWFSTYGVGGAKQPCHRGHLRLSENIEIKL